MSTRSVIPLSFTDGLHYNESDSLKRKGENDDVERKLGSASSFLTGLFFILIGILLLSEYTSFWLLVWVLLIVAFLWMGFNELILYRRTQRQKTQLLKAALLIGLAGIIAGWPKLFFRFLHIVIGWWALFSGIIQFLCFPCLPA